MRSSAGRRPTSKWTPAARIDDAGRRLKMRNWRNSSTWKLFLYFFTGFVLLSVVVTAFLHQYIQKLEKDHLDRSITHVETVHLPFLVPALWITDHESLQRQIEGIASLDYIKRVEVRDDRGEVFSAGAEASPSLDVITRGLVYVNRGRSQDIGTISLRRQERLRRSHF